MIFFNFGLDQPQAVAPTVTDKDVALETDFYTDWKLTKNFTAIVVAFANPGSAVEQATGRTSSFRYGMVYARLHLLTLGSRRIGTPPQSFKFPTATRSCSR